jgi:hypothetical protein
MADFKLVPFVPGKIWVCFKCGDEPTELCWYSHNKLVKGFDATDNYIKLNAALKTKLATKNRLDEKISLNKHKLVMERESILWANGVNVLCLAVTRKNVRENKND